MLAPRCARALRLAPSLFVVAASVLGSGCEVSVFGGEPVSVFGGASPSSGHEAGLCGEPEELRVARVALTDATSAPSDEESPCAYRCVFEAGALVGDASACDLVTVEGDHLVIDMARADSVLARVDACTNSVLHLGDARAARADGSDDPSSSHDASVLLRDGRLALLPASGGELSRSDVDAFVPADATESCVARTLELTDSVVYLPDVERGLCGTSMLRVDPPTDAQGQPDSRWYLALGHTLDGTVTGAAPRVDLCFL